MMHQRGQHLLQLQEQPFARGVAIGIHVKLNGKLTSYLFHLTSYIICEQRCRGDGDSLMTSRQQTPTIATALSYEELVARLQQIQNRQIVDATLRPLRKAEAGQSPLYQVAILNTHQLAITIVIRCLQPRHALLILPRSEPAPANNPWVNSALIKQKLPSLWQKPRTLEEPLESCRIKRLLHLISLSGLPLIKDDVMLIGQPTAGLLKVLAEMPHHQVNRTY